MADRMTLMIENRRFLLEAASNPARYIDFLGTMARFHKYEVLQQMSLFFHAPSSVEAVATAEFWEKTGHPVKREAMGIPVLIGNAAQEELSYLYSVHDAEGMEGKNVLWKFDNSKHMDIAEALFPADTEQQSLEDRILIQSRKLAQNSGLEDKELAALSTAYVVMERMGLNTENVEFDLIQHSWMNVKSLETLQAVNQYSRQLLLPLEQQIHEMERTKNGRTDIEKNGRNRGNRGRSGNQDDGRVGQPAETLPDEREAGVLGISGGERGSRELSGEDTGGLSGQVRENVSSTPERPELPGGQSDGDGLADVGTDEDSVLGTGEGDPAQPDTVVENTKGETLPIIEDDSAEVLADIDYEADLSTVSGQRRVFIRNLEAIKLLKRLENEDRQPDENELKLLKSYAGFGGLAEAFNENNSAWTKEYNELRKNLTDSEFSAARASTLNAHYTNEEIIRQVYRAVEKIGFTKGNVLEPAAGNGRFFDAMPENMRNNSHLFGVELDPLSSRIAAKIHNDVTMSNQSFESTKFADNSFDMAISNVPFGNYQVTSDVAHRADNLLIHDYFIVKMLDEVRPGGLVVAMTSSGTMDKRNDSVRWQLARKAELISAIRLPNTAFKEAGTDVTADILVFKKREKELTNSELIQADETYWINTDRHKSGSEVVTYNEYWEQHHDAVMGRFAVRSTAYGPTLTCNPNTDEPLTEQLADYIDNHLLEDMKKHGKTSYEEAAEPLPVPVQEKIDSRPYGVFYENGSIVFHRATGTTEVLELQPKQQRKILSAIHIREAVYDLLEAQRNGCSDADLAKLQRMLNNLYDEHVSYFGRITNDRELNRILTDEPSLPLIRAFEVFDDKVFQRKADIFTQRTVNSAVRPDHADTAEDALKISMTEKGKVDLNYMASLTDMDVSNIIDALEFKDIYYDIETQSFQQSDEYLSGDIRQKIENLQARRHELNKKLEQAKMKKLYPDWDKITYEPQNELEKKLILAIKDNRRLYWSDFTQEEINIIEEEKANRNLHILVRGAASTTFHTPEHFQTDMLFHLEALKYHSNHINNDLSRLFSTIGLASVPNSRIVTMIENGNTRIAAAYNFLLENAAAYPTMGTEEEKVVFLDKLALEWEQYQQEKNLEIARLVQEDTTGDFLNINKEIEQIDKNIAALEDVKPKDLKPSEISVSLGSTWIAPSYIKQFLAEELRLSYYEAQELEVEYSDVTGKWRINNKNISGNAKVDNTYGTADINALALCELALNLKQPKVHKTVYINGEEKRKVDTEKTVKAQLKMEELKNAFSRWIWKDSTRAEHLADYYNRHFNNIRPREYNGENLTFPGMAADIKLKPHQKDAIAHTLYGGNTLLAHCVGAGKTFEMTASAMEAKRLGIANKSMFVVPKHLTEQTGAEFRRLYPGAKILVATKKDFEKDNRKEFCAKIATQDWDAVILGYTQFEKISLTPERQEAILKQQINDLIRGIAIARNESESRFTIKQMEIKKKELEAKLTKLEKREAKDDTIYFEDLGIDRLYVDEAHYFKNLYTPTKLSNVSGVSTSDAQKTTDLYEKCMYLNEKTNGKGIIFATGTPISNSMTELYTMQRYLQPDRLKSEQMESFDSWASIFGQTTLAMEISPEGKGFREKTRFAKFQNLPELMNMVKEFADIKTPDMINLKVPECEYIVEKIPASAEQKKMVDDLAARAKDVRDGKVSSDEDNMLKITNEGRLLALDPRCIDPSMPDRPDSKVNKCVENVLQIYRETADDKLTQLIFCDKSTPKKDGSFSVYDDIKAKLIAEGVKESEIAFIHDANNDKQKEALFERVRNGEVRVLLGSTDKLGVGTNVQDRLIATHDLDVPWRPSDLEQRGGRIVRQGNQNKNVKIFRYVTEGTFDAYLWQLIESKQRFISQIMTSKQPVRVADDCDELTLTYSEIKACATGNPLIKEKMEVDNEVQRLTMAKNEFLASRADLERKCNTVYPRDIQACREIIERLQDAKMIIDSHTYKNEDGTEKFSLQLNGKFYTDPKEASAALSEVAKGDMTKVSGEYKGMKLSMVMDYETHTPTIVLLNKISRRIPLTTGGTTNIRRMDSTLENIAYDIKYHKNQLEQVEHSLEVAKAEIDKPFDKEDLLQEKIARAKELEIILQTQDDERDNMPDKEAESEKRRIEILEAVDGQGHLQPDKLPENPAERSFKVYSCMQLMRHRKEAPDLPWRDDYDLNSVKHLLGQGIDKETISKVVAKFSPSIPSIESVANMVDSLTATRQAAVAVR